jgi:hypothetical protein
MPPKLMATKIRTANRPAFFSINACAFFIV